MMMRAFFSVAIALAMLVNVATGAIAAKSSEIYLDKLDKTLDDWWNALDAVCVVSPVAARPAIWLVSSVRQ